MASNTQNVKMGVCQVSFGGEDLGYTKGGVDVTVATESKPVEVDQFGNSPINEIITGRTCKVKVPLAETTLENLVRIMPGAILTNTGGAKATGTITLATAVPVTTDYVTINGVKFTYKTMPLLDTDVAIGGTYQISAANLAAAINASINPLIDQLTATVAGAVVTLTADDAGTAGNAMTVSANFATGANVTVVGFSGGTDATKKKVVVPNAVGTSLLDMAQVLVIHPVANDPSDHSDDFTIPLAMTPGAMQFAYKLDQERVFDCEFMAYPDPNNAGQLFIVGDPSAS
jgi:hypothetical protein